LRFDLALPDNQYRIAPLRILTKFFQVSQLNQNQLKGS
jgi:hypothetical protein